MIEEVKLPEISENVESGVVIAALVKVGDFVDKEQPLVELETEKATFEVPSPVSGKVVEMSVSEEDDVKVGQVIAKIDTDAQASGQEEEETVEAQPTPVVEEKAAVPEVVEQPEVRHETQPQEEKPAPAKAVSAAPAVRQLARELGIDIALVSGSGQGGRISAEDVRDHADSVKAASKWAGVGGASIPLPDFAKWGQVERQAMTVTRRKIAETLSYAWANVPHVTQHDQANITALEQFRAEYSERVGQAGGKLTVTSILVKVPYWPNNRPPPRPPMMGAASIQNTYQILA
ncbi:MAG: biotin/lipoyl-containing protein [Planctomycetota bacterium]|jgi:pyruvate dehydrogenase E2 component (dihydrolipoamide acetyltransferase)